MSYEGCISKGFGLHFQKGWVLLSVGLDCTFRERERESCTSKGVLIVLPTRLDCTSRKCGLYWDSHSVGSGPNIRDIRNLQELFSVVAGSVRHFII